MKIYFPTFTMETKKPLKHLCQQVSSPPKGCEREKICPSQSVLINNEIIIMGQWFLEEDNKVKREWVKSGSMARKD